MATLPQASLTINEGACAFAGGTGYAVVMACVNQNADSVPRVISSTQDLLTEYNWNQGVDYCALHFAESRKPVIFVGMPITTAGAVKFTNNTGVTGTAAITVAAASSGIMEEVDAGSVTVLTGTNVGTDQIVLSLSLDGGVSTQTVRLGSNTSYTIPYVGIVLNFGAGTLNVGDVFTFATSAPMWGSTALSTARTALARQQNLARSWMVVGDLPNSTFANYVVTEANNYASTNQRFTYARAQVADRLPLATKSQVSVHYIPGSSSETLTFASSGHTITRSAGSFITDGFAIGMMVTVGGADVSNVGAIGVLTNVSATVLTFASGVVNEGPLSGVTLVASEALTFASSGDTVTRTIGSWISDGFAVGQSVKITGTTSNNVTETITVLSATVMTFGAGLANEGPIAGAAVSVQQVNAMASWVSSTTAAFATVDAQKRVDLGAGRAVVQSPITGWNMRRPCQWAVSTREYQHDLQIPTYRKADGNLDPFQITDANGNTPEYDERLDGGLLAGRFTCLRSYANGPLGAFVALSLTRDSEGAILSRTHNMAVTNLASTVVQKETENAIGQVLVLNADGTGTDASLSLIEQRVNSALQVNLLQQFAEGQRASLAVWTASRTNVLNTPGATLNGTLALELDGTLENIETSVVIQTAGA